MTQNPDPIALLDELANGYQNSQVLFTALEGGVFELLTAPRTADEVAGSTGWHPRGARMLLDGLVALGLAEKAGGRYTNGPAAQACLVEGAPADQRRIVQHRANCRGNWALLPESVRMGTTAVQCKGERTEEDLRAFICGMSNVASRTAPPILDAVDLSGCKHMLDVAGGPGTYSLIFLKAHPGMRATVFDLPPVVEIAKEEAEKAGMLDRVDFIAGDLKQHAFGTGYDLVFISNIIHSYGPEGNQALMQKSFDCLEPGGLLIVKDFLTDPERSGPPFSLMFALHMLTATEAGDTYPAAEVAAWTDAAGFEPGKLVDLTPQTRLWLARKPA